MNGPDPVPPLRGSLVRTSTPDRLELVGFFAAPDNWSGTAALHIHGLDGNFYENRFLDAVGAAYLERGVAFLTANNRGHEYISDSLCQEPGADVPESKQIGGVYELLEESVLDIRGWREFLERQGARSVLFQGHSHGALKAVNYLAREHDPMVTGLVLLSPSDDFGQIRELLGDEFASAVALARELVESGQGRQLMPEQYFASPISARTFLDTFRSDSPAQIFNLSGTDRREFPELGALTVPVLLVLGTEQEAFVGDAEEFARAIRARCRRVRSFDQVVLEGASHQYLGHERALADAVRRWLPAVLTR